MGDSSSPFFAMQNTLLERILVPLDGTAADEAVVPLLEPILRHSRAEVFLVRALPPSGAVREAQDYVQRIADRLLSEGVCAHPLVEIGSPPEVIESLVANEEITMIAVAAQAGGMGQLLRDSGRPVVVLRPGPPRADLSRKRATILAPLDGSEAARRGLPLALDLAGVLDARVVLLRVIEREDEETEALEDLQEEAERLNRLGWHAEIWIERGEPAEKILEISRQEDVRMVVLTTSGRSQRPGRALGTVAERLLRDAPVPVLAMQVPGP